MSVEEACVLARRTIYHTTFRNGASGLVISNVIPNFQDTKYLAHIIIFVSCHMISVQCGS